MAVDQQAGRPVNLGHVGDLLREEVGRAAGEAAGLVAAGGWCAPGFLSLWDQPWTRPDRGWVTELDVAGWLFPRWAQLERAGREARRRLTAARVVLATGQAPGRACDCDRWG